MEHNIHFIGIGGAGSNVAEYFHSLHLIGNYTLISDPIRSDLSSEINFVYFESGKEKLKSTTNISELFSQNNISNYKSIQNIFEGDETFVLLTGLGGYTGTILTYQLISYLESKRKNYLIIASLPLAFESEKAISISNKFINILKDNKRIQYFALEELKLKNGDIQLNHFFEKANERFVELYYNGIKEFDSL